MLTTSIQHSSINCVQFGKGEYISHLWCLLHPEAIYCIDSIMCACTQRTVPLYACVYAAGSSKKGSTTRDRTDRQHRCVHMPRPHQQEAYCVCSACSVHATPTPTREAYCVCSACSVHAMTLVTATLWMKCALCWLQIVQSCLLCGCSVCHQPALFHCVLGWHACKAAEPQGYMTSAAQVLCGVSVHNLVIIILFMCQLYY